MNPNLRKGLKYLGYGAYATILFVTTIWLLFPYDRLKQMITQAIDSDGRYEVTIDDVGPAFPFGLEITGIKIVSPPEKKGDKPGKLFVERARVFVSPFSVFSDTKKVSVEIDALGGHIETDVETKGKAKKISIKFSGVSMSKLPGIAKAISLPMTGSFSGSGHIEIPKEGLRRAGGKFTLACKSCTLGDGKTKVKMDFRPKHLKKRRPNILAEQGVTLPMIRLGRFGGDIEIKRGKATFRQFESLSPDGEAFLMGTMTLRDPFPFSNVDAYFKFKFDEELKEREPKWKAIEAGLAKGRRSDRYYGFSIRGRFKDPPRFLPARTSSVERLYDRKGSKRRGRRRGGRAAMNRRRPRAIMRPPRPKRSPRAKSPARSAPNTIMRPLR
jgi:type II secretion system protein N